ncbi:hypothetical protein JCM10213_008956 [Rhodosporidiobolus nylandii]
MADYQPHHQQQPQTIAPSSLTSRPLTPSRSSSSSGSHSAHTHTHAAFDPQAYLVGGDPYPSAAPLPLAPLSASSLDFDSAASAVDALAGMPLPFAGAGPMTRAASGASSSGGGGGGGKAASSSTAAAATGGAGGFVSFDPSRGSPSEPEDSDEDAERAVEGRPRKRKSTRDLRGAAAAQPKEEEKEKSGADEDKGRRKIQIEYIEEKSKRHITFSKRKAGIMKKAYELSTLTGTQVLLLVVSESGWVYTFTTDKFKPLVKEDENGQLSQGQKLIAACLEAKDGSPNLSAAAYQPSSASSTGNFEANSSIHGGQISLKTGQRAARPTATNRRVSSKGRGAIPNPVYTGPPNGGGMGGMDLPCPPGSGGIPPVPQLPTPLSGNYLDGGLGGVPPSTRGPPGQGVSHAQQRSVSHPPISPARPGYSMQQQQQQLPHYLSHQQQGQDYVEMTQNLHLQSGGYEPQYDLYNSVPPSSMPPSHLSHHSYADLPPLSHHHQHSHLQHQHPSALSSAPHTPHRGLHHTASHASLSDAYASDAYNLPPPGNYTHARNPSLSSLSGMDPRQQQQQQGGGGWQTPQHQHHGGGGMQGTPQHQQMYGGGGQQIQVGGDEYGR